MMMVNHFFRQTPYLHSPETGAGAATRTAGPREHAAFSQGKGWYLRVKPWFNHGLTMLQPCRKSWCRLQISWIFHHIGFSASIWRDRPWIVDLCKWIFFLFIWSILEPSRVQTLVLTQKDRDFLYRASLQSENRRRKVKSIEIRSHQDMGGLLLTFHELFGCLFCIFSGLLYGFCLMLLGENKDINLRGNQHFPMPVYQVRAHPCRSKDIKSMWGLL